MFAHNTVAEVKKLRLALVALMLTLGACNNTQPPQDNVNNSWTGKWQGQLVNIPARPDAKPVDVTMEIGPLPEADNACATWRTTYSEEGVVRAVKDYRLCRGQGAEDLFIDEGGGVKLPARWIGDVLVSPFKYNNILLISSMRLRGEVLEDEILVVDDKPAIEGVQPLFPRSIQRTELRRVAEGSE